uniref:G patch domain-containing protein 4 n=1 Tax=Ornithorhynchus anatinus TaxID=9258 RepID=A0A6I8NU31_ORNAN
MEGASRGLNFAEQQLQRHGWTPGKGLGRREDGIAKAIKVKMKQDNAGVGHDPAEQFTNHWWSHLFNRTAAKIVVETGQNGVQMKTKEDTSASRSRKAPSLLYGHFVKVRRTGSSGCCRATPPPPLPQFPLTAPPLALPLTAPSFPLSFWVTSIRSLYSPAPQHLRKQCGRAGRGRGL